MCDCGFPNALWHFPDAESLYEPRPRAVPAVGSGGFVGPSPHTAPAMVHPREVLAVFRNGKRQFYKVGPMQPVDEAPLPPFRIPEDWSRGFDYDSLGEGHYEDTDI